MNKSSLFHVFGAEYEYCITQNKNISLVPIFFKLFDKEKPTLSHQRFDAEGMKVPLDKWYDRGVKKAKVAKFRKGAWTNCGAMTHDAKFWVERPRKVNAKVANKTFGYDENVQKLNLTFEAKMDRWNGYEPEMYNKEVIPEWNKLEEERVKLRAQQQEEEIKNKAKEPKNEIDEMMSDSDLEEDSADEVQDKEIDPNSTDLMKNPRVKTLNKNLRSRQETVKYIQNIWDNNAHYDGKSRAMRTNPNEEVSEEKLYKGDNARIYSGQFLDLMDQDNFTKEAKDKGEVELNSVAMPSQAELAFKHFKEKKTQLMTEKQKELYEKYGGQEHAEIPDDIKKKALEEHYELIEKAKKAIRVDLQKKSKYAEDICQKGHTQVWGSFWHQHFGWGYKCWYSFNKTGNWRGEIGIKEFYAKEYELKYKKKPDLEIEAKREKERIEKQKQEEETKMKEITGVLGEIMKSQSKKNEENSSKSSASDNDSSSSDASSSSSSDNKKRKKRKRSSSSSSSDSSSSSSSSDSSPKRKRDKKNKKKKSANPFDLEGQELDQEKLKEAIKKEKEKRKNKKYHDDSDKRYNSLKANNTTITAEELEAYRMQREIFEDPMRNFKNKDDD